MNKKNQTDMSNLYRAVPRMDSPEHLDQKILAEARRMAPERVGKVTSIVSRGWIPATATVCMIGLAVFVARPVLFNLDQPEFNESGAVIQDQKLEDNVGPVGSQGETVGFAGPAEVKEKEKPGDLPMSTETLSGVAPDSTGQMLERSKQQVQLKQVTEARKRKQQEEEKMLESGLKLDSKDFVTDQTEAHAQPERKSEVTSQAGVSKTGAESDATEFAPPPAILNSETLEPQTLEQELSEFELAETFEKIKYLVSEKKMEAARILLDELKRRCPHCDIPDSIDEIP